MNTDELIPIINNDYYAEKLYQASEDGKPSEILNLLQIGVNPNNIDYYKAKHDGQSPLHESCYNNHSLSTEYLLKWGASCVSITNDFRSTPLHYACMGNSKDCVRLLLEHHSPTGLRRGGRQVSLLFASGLGWLDDIKQMRRTITSSSDMDSLSLACANGHLEVVKYLIPETISNGSASWSSSNGNPLYEACINGHLKIAEYLIAKNICGLNDAVNLACANGNLDTVKYLVEVYQCDPRCTVENTSDTPITLAYRGGHWEVVKYLARIHDCDMKEIFYLSCKHGHLQDLECLLTEFQINPNIVFENGETPLSLAKNKEMIQLLLQHGAVAEDAYVHHRKILGNLFSKSPLKSAVKMFVIGQGGEGKSTLIEAMENEPSRFAPLVNLIVSPKEVEGVSKKTAGIIPRVFKSRFYGDVLFHDFAGQEAYYSSHAAVIKSAVGTCPPIFVLVVGLHREDHTICKSVFYWLGIIANQCSSMEGKGPLIVVGSHIDLCEDKSEVVRKKQVISQAVEKFPTFNFIDFIPIDCRYSNSNGMKLLRHTVGTSCNLIRSKLAISLNSHMFLVYLLDNYSNEMAITLQAVQSKIKEDFTQALSVKHRDVLPFIPTTLHHLSDICIQLSDKGHILYLSNEQSLQNGFIIIDKAALLANIDGTIFAPEDFKQHCQLATSTGVVPRSKLSEHFRNFDIEMLIKFLLHLELAVPIQDLEILSLINKQLSTSNELASPNNEEYLFCPALIRIEVPPRVFVHEEELPYHFGWMLSCVQTHDFLDARFLHVLILRLALYLGIAPSVNPDVPALQHHCSVWKTGVCWSTTDGVKTLVEVISRKQIIVFIQARTISLELMHHQSRVLKKVTNTVGELCPCVVTEELLVPSASVIYPPNESTLASVFSLKSVAQSIIESSYVVSTNGVESLPLSDLLPVEVFANLGPNILQAFFNDNDPGQDAILSNKLLLNLCVAWRKSTHLPQIICSAINREVVTASVTNEESIRIVLMSWRDANKGTCRSLREIIDTFSVFFGRNPVELAGMSLKPFSESSLLMMDDSVLEHNEGTPNTLNMCRTFTERNPSVLTDVAYYHNETDPPGFDQLPLAKVMELIKEMRSDWYSLAIQLQISYGVRKYIDRNKHNDVDDCFYIMLKHWVRRPFPLPTWSVLIRALESPVIERGDIARKIESEEKISVEPQDDNITLLIDDIEAPLIMDKHLKIVREITWDLRAKWWDLGLELRVSTGTLEAEKRNLQNESSLCYTAVLEHWLTRTTQPPTLSSLIAVLKSPVIDRQDIANNLSQ